MPRKRFSSPRGRVDKWCDLSCRHARFPQKAALQGACNTMQALYCRKHRRLVPKNGPCLDPPRKAE